MRTPHRRIIKSHGFVIAIMVIGMMIFIGSCRRVWLSRNVDTVSVTECEPEQRGVENDLTLEAEAYADSMLRNLSLKRKIGMLFMPAVYADSSPASMRGIMEYADSLHVGGLVLLKGDLRSVALISDSLRNHQEDPPMLLAVDAENGLRMRFSDAPEFPWNRDLGRISDDQLLYEFGREIARECREVGINMVLGPVMDVLPEEGSHGIMRKRSLGSDRRRVAELAIAYARGIEDGNVMTVAKHFPGHGSSPTDSHKGLGEIPGSRQRIDSIDLYPFHRYSAAGLSGIMIGHLSAASLDTVRRPAIVSPVIMKEILRKEMKFRGLVITDALNMEGAMGVQAWQAIASGADIVIAPLDTRREIGLLAEAIRNHDMRIADLNDRCRRILIYKYLMMARDDHRRINAAEAAEKVNSKARQMQDTLREAIRKNGDIF